MKASKLGLVALTLGAVVTGALLLSGAHAEEVSKGQEIFLAQKCNMCHSVSSATIEKTSKMDGGDLAGTLEGKDLDWFTQYVTKQVDMDGKKHAKEMKGTPEELKSIYDWLAAQKKP